MSRPLFRRSAVVAACLLISAGLVSPSGAPAQQAAERPLVVDFYVLDADGVSVPDVRPDEVTIRINGRNRTIQSLRLVKQGEPPPADPLSARPMISLEPFATNGVAESGRSFVVVIDDETLRPGQERPVRAALNAFVAALTPKDRLSLWTIPRGGMKVDLTRNHDRFSQAMQVVVGHAPETESGSEGACRTRTALEAMEHLLGTMEDGEGPTNIIVLTNSMYGPRRDAPATMAPGMCEITFEQFQRVGRVAAQVRAHFYIVQSEDVVPRAGLMTENIAGAGGFRGSDNPTEGIENLAGVTGGTRMSLARAGDQSLVAIARATVSYYSAVLDGTSADVDGHHGMDVRVSRPGVNVRHRGLLAIRRPTAAAGAPVSPTDMVKSRASFTELPIRVAGFTSVHSGEELMRVIAAAEPVDPNVRFTAMSAALFDGEGRMAAQFNAGPAELDMRPSLAAMVVPRGVYRLRVAATDAAGRSGAADAEVVAEVVEVGSLKLSSVVLGVSPAGRFQPRLQFSTEILAVAYLDLFSSKANAPVAAIIEVARTPDGPPIVTNRLSIEATVDAGRYSATGSLPVGALPPGDYVVRVIVGIEGEPFAQVFRGFRKVGQ